VGTLSVSLIIVLWSGEVLRRQEPEKRTTLFSRFLTVRLTGGGGVGRGEKSKRMKQ
jgi:hypothetical protein